MAYLIGTITNTHGIKGEVKIYSLSDFDRFLLGKTIYTEIKGKRIDLTIDSVRAHKNLLIVKFRSYDDINQIEYLKGANLFSDEEVIDQMDADDYHYQQLIGKQVYVLDGSKVGVVKSVLEVPQGHLLEIEKPDGKNALIPFIDAFVKEVKEEGIILTPIEGLL